MVAASERDGSRRTVTSAPHSSLNMFWSGALFLGWHPPPRGSCLGQVSWLVLGIQLVERTDWDSVLCVGVYELIPEEACVTLGTDQELASV